MNKFDHLILMTLKQVQEALSSAISSTNNAILYTNIVASTADLLTNYSQKLDNFIRNNRVSVYSIEKYKKKKVQQLIDQLHSYESLFKIADSSTTINTFLHSFNYPISQPLESIQNSMNSIYTMFKGIGINVPKFTVIDSDLADDLVSLYGIFATNENEETSKRFNEVKELMKSKGISLPSTNVKEFSLDDFFGSIEKFKIDHLSIQKGKLIDSKTEGDYFNGVYTKNEETVKVTILEIPECNINLENYQREVT